MRSLSALPAALLALLLPTLVSAEELQIDTTKDVTCTRPSQPGDKLTVHYRGTLPTTGEIFDESYKRGKPFTFTLGSGQVIKGWDEGMKDMCPGEERRLTIPSDMAYGDFGSPPVIPGKATLVFETKLVEIVGVDAGVVESLEHVENEDGFVEGATQAKSVSLATETAAPVTEEGGFTIATAPPEPTPTFIQDTVEDSADAATPVLEAQPLRPSESGGEPDEPAEGECHLLGPFALIVQGALGVMALLALVYKRLRETPKRPWTIWFFDVSKQVVGSMLLHGMNLLFSMLGAGDIEHASQTAVNSASSKEDNEAVAAAGGRSRPNPCSYYLLNLLIDTTIGIAILYLLLKIVHTGFSYTPLARPRESIKSGHYGNPPHPSWWLKQSLLYFIGLFGMKLFVLLLFLILPWLPWVGDWMLRWTEGNEALEIAFVMFIFPLLMNGIQYWIIDSFIMDKSRGKEGGVTADEGGEYERVGQQGRYDGEDGSDDFVVGDDEDDPVKDAEEGTRKGRGLGETERLVSERRTD